ncbi:MAG TPA: isoprenylcysteine carboxylmethyltransferase family protein [Roseiflexaceae bacterium]|nr:isoprenylcysteine carboxylmethyltransferase family protein [Roseiflexaceae bacterium]
MSAVCYSMLLAAVGLGRLIELRLSRRHQRLLASQGVVKVREPHFRWMVLLHGGVLLGAGLEVWLLKRPLIRALAIPMSVLWVLANGLRLWVIYTMAEHWNVQVLDSVRLGVVTDGPFRWIRHPNYLAVFIELVALPLLHTAWVTALLGGLAHVWVLRQRIVLEERTLLSDSNYRALMGHKPRYVPRIW